jgi:uncharacterized membrane protein YcaP (DUF421 family)
MRSVGLSVADDADMLFHSWSDLWRVVISATTTFVVIVIILRIVGSQAIAKMSAYDMIATVTFGSIVSTVAVTRGVTIAEAVTAMLTLIVLQEVMRFLQSRWLPAHHAMREPPLLVVWEGTLLEDRLREHRISADEVRAAVRRQGMSSLSEARLVVLENDGEWSVVPESSARGDDSALFGLPIPGWPGNGRADEAHRAEPAPPHRLP